MILHMISDGKRGRQVGFVYFITDWPLYILAGRASAYQRERVGGYASHTLLNRNSEATNSASA